MSDAVAHYLWPPRWIEGPPSGLRDTPELFSGPQIADVGDRVFETEFSPDLRLRVCRDGMFAWDCFSWARKPVEEKQDLDELGEFQIRCARLMNAYLGCLHTYLTHATRISAVTAKHLLGVRFSDCRLESGTSEEPTGFNLGLSRDEFDVDDPGVLRLLPVVPVEALQAASDLFRQLLTRADQDIALFRAEMLFRGVIAYQDFDYGAALGHGWMTIEGLLSDLFRSYLNDQRDREADEPGMEFMNSKRKRYLEGSQVTTRVTTEILSLAGRLPHSLYRKILTSAKARNSWLHGATPDIATRELATTTIKTAELMFEHVEGVKLSMHLERAVHSV